jgi:predicted nucleic acid-binding protein
LRGFGPIEGAPLLPQRHAREVMVDSSVWIAWLRGTTSEPVAKLAELANVASLLLGDLILLELLQGARDDRHARAIEAKLGAFRRVALVGFDVALASASHFRELRARGVTVRKAVDLIVGTWCIRHDVALLHDDRDFGPMREYLGLRVV